MLSCLCRRNSRKAYLLDLIYGFPHEKNTITSHEIKHEQHKVPDKKKLRHKKSGDSTFSFSSGIGHKLKTDSQECYENVCGIVNLAGNERTSSQDKSDNFTTAALDYLNRKRTVRTWRTLWMAEKPATTMDKIE
jgi:hypothetical protein